MRCFTLPAMLLAFSLSVSCSKTEQTRHRVSGEVLFDNKPIPYGAVFFTPDGANPGAQGTAMIKDGKFDTAGTDGKGFAGGPTIIRVSGLSGPSGPPLCDYEYKADLPVGETTLKIEVPATAAPKKAGPDI